MRLTPTYSKDPEKEQRVSAEAFLRTLNEAKGYRKNFELSGSHSDSIWWNAKTESEYAKVLTHLSDKMTFATMAHILGPLVADAAQSNFELTMIFHSLTGKYRDQNPLNPEVTVDTRVNVVETEGDIPRYTTVTRKIDARKKNSPEENAEILRQLSIACGRDLKEFVPAQLKGEFKLPVSADLKDSKGERQDAKLGEKLTWG